MLSKGDWTSVILAVCCCCQDKGCHAAKMIENSCGANTVKRGVTDNVYSALSARRHREMPQCVLQATHSSCVVVKPALNAFRHTKIQNEKQKQAKSEKTIPYAHNTQQKQARPHLRALTACRAVSSASKIFPRSGCAEKLTTGS
jgi:hypothetical protein